MSLTDKFSLKGISYPLTYLFDSSFTLNLEQFSLAGVIINQGCGLIKINLQSLFYRFFLIISTLVEFTAALVTYPLYFRRRVNLVVGSLALAAYPSPGQPFQEFRLRNLGDQPLVIGQISRSCGCTGAIVEKTTVGPGESTPLRISLETRKASGRIEVRVVLPSNDPQTPLLELLLHATVVEDATR